MDGVYSKAIDPPKFEAMDLAWRTLMDLGIVEGQDQKSRLTALGRHVSEGRSGLGMLSCYDPA